MRVAVPCNRVMTAKAFQCIRKACEIQGITTVASQGTKFGTKRWGIALLAGAAFVAALPSAVAAASNGLIDTADAESMAGRILSVGSDGLAAFTPSSADPRLLARLSSAQGDAQDNSGIFRFTPAGAKKTGKRAVTVAVRVNTDTVRAISMRAGAVGGSDAGRGASIPSISPVAFNLGMARGYQGFGVERGESNTIGRAGSGAGIAGSANRTLPLPGEVRKLDMPDLSSFTPSKAKPSRFSATVNLDERQFPVDTVRGGETGSDVSVDVGGAYRVARNLKVTAGLRYSADRNRIAPLTDEEQDAQAVYVGTQFRF